MKKYAKLVKVGDNVVTSVADIGENETFIVKTENGEKSYKSNQKVDFGHKIAVEEIKKGEQILKYGQEIGIATADIKVGDWVHIHNVRDNYEVK